MNFKLRVPKTITNSIRILEPRARNDLRKLIGLAFIKAVADLLSIISVLPFLAILTNPGSIERNSFMRAIYDLGQFQNTNSFLSFAGFAVIIALSFAAGMRILFTYNKLDFCNKVRWKTSNKLLIKYLNSEYRNVSKINRSHHSSLILSETNRISVFWYAQILNLTSALTASVFIVIGLFAVNVILTLLVSIVFTGFYAIVYFGFSRFYSRWARAVFDYNQKSFRVIQEALGGIKTTRLYAVESMFAKDFDETYKHFALLNTRMQTVQQMPKFVLEFLAFSIIIVVAILYINNNSTRDIVNFIPQLGFFALAGYKLLPNIQSIYSSVNQLKHGAVSLNEIHDRLMLETTLDYLKKRSPAYENESLNKIELKAVKFKFESDERLILDDVNLTVRKNEFIGVVGYSGSGKTTLIDIILGLMQPTSGQVLINDEIVGASEMRNWQQHIGYVPQDVFLRDVSVAENIAFGETAEELDINAVRRSSKSAQSHNFIESELPNGYQTIVGDQGGRLSGGQRQRLGIARALYHDPDLLIFDEATSALDRHTEAELLSEIESFRGQKTLIVIAHRPQTIRSCDRIIVLANGRVQDQGSFDELIARNAYFEFLAKDVSDSN